jgi:hypothetical protein
MAGLEGASDAFFSANKGRVRVGGGVQPAAAAAALRAPAVASVRHQLVPHMKLSPRRLYSRCRMADHKDQHVASLGHQLKWWQPTSLSTQEQWPITRTHALL